MLPQNCNTAKIRYLEKNLTSRKAKTKKFKTKRKK